MKRDEFKGKFQTFDGEELVYRSWGPKKDSNSKKALIVLHRGHEHSGRVFEQIERVGADDFHAFSYDGRGHGENPGERGYAPSFSHTIKDLDSFVHFISKKHEIPVENIVVLANSVGAVITSAWVHDYAPRIRGMVLAAPAFKIKLYVPFAMAGLRILNFFKKKAFISSYVKSKFLTHDVEEQRKYDSDKLITPQIAVNILLGLFDTSKRVVEDAGAITTPTLVLSAEKDYVVDSKIQKFFYERLSSPLKRFVSLKGFYHGVLYEKNREEAFKECAEFIDDCFKVESTNNWKPVSHYTQKEYSDLMHKHTPVSRDVMYLMQRASMKTLGWMSEGMKVGMKHGFDSGLSLDHVYGNTAKGFSPVGKAIDYFYINAIGWRGIRQRKVHIQDSLNKAIDSLLEEGKSVRIMDIAAGPGRYLIEVAKRREREDIKVLVRDNTPANIEQGKKIASELHCENVDFEVASAFDKSTYKYEDFQPNIVVVSGLFELFEDNDLIQEAISAISETVASGGFVIYTGQPWHPQLELIANTLPNRDGNKWVMRRRTQLELDALFETHGIKKENMDIDEWGIFTVSTARPVLKKNVEAKAS